MDKSLTEEISYQKLQLSNDTEEKQNIFLFLQKSNQDVDVQQAFLLKENSLQKTNLRHLKLLFQSSFLFDRWNIFYKMSILKKKGEKSYEILHSFIFLLCYLPCSWRR